jgi:hypothetical protein
MKLILPKLRPEQLDFITHPAKTKTLIAGRRFGKTIMAKVPAFTGAFYGMRVSWFVPEYKNSSLIMWDARRDLSQIINAKYATINLTSKRVTFRPSHHDEGTIQIYTAKNADQARGDFANLIVIDEAAMIPDDIYFSVIAPTAADYNAPVIVITTPRGRNSWVYDFFVRGKNNVHGFTSRHYPTHQNPLIGIQQWLKEVEPIMPERTWQREILAQFDDGGVVFNGISECMGSYFHNPENSNSDNIMGGVDWGKEDDYTAISLIDFDTKMEVYHERFNKISYVYQVERILEIAREWNVQTLRVEKNSIGNPLLDMLYDKNDTDCNIVPFTLDNKVKADMIEWLALCFERQTYQWIDDPDWTAELESFESTVMNNGTIKYNAPSGKHDDTVIARAAACYNGRYSSFFY